MGVPAEANLHERPQQMASRPSLAGRLQHVHASVFNQGSPRCAQRRELTMLCTNVLHASTILPLLSEFRSRTRICVWSTHVAEVHCSHETKVYSRADQDRPLTSEGADIRLGRNQLHILLSRALGVCRPAWKIHLLSQACRMHGVYWYSASSVLWSQVRML